MKKGVLEDLSARSAQPWRMPQCFQLEIIPGHVSPLAQESMLALQMHTFKEQGAGSREHTSLAARQPWYPRQRIPRVLPWPCAPATASRSSPPAAASHTCHGPQRLHLSERCTASLHMCTTMCTAASEHEPCPESLLICIAERAMQSQLRAPL